MKFKVIIITVIVLTLLSGTALASPTLSLNSRGEDVLTLQKKLYMIGYNITEFDGVYDKETEKAVSAFQRDHKITVTGIVTNVTWRALRKEKDKKGRVLPAIKVKPAASKNTTSKNTKSKKFDTNFDTNSPTTSAPFGKSFITGDQADAIISTARNFMGVPYVFGGTTPKGFDCSGLLQYVFKMNGVSIPRLADEQYKLGKSAKISQLTAGDLVFFTTYTSGVSHCGIYVGDRKFLHASSSKGVKIDSLDDDYWKKRFVGAKKVVSG